MANVKVPALLHKMSKAAQKAWYKKNNMTMPSEVEGGGRSAAAAKRVVAPAPRKQMAAAPQSVRAMNTARQQAYYAKGGRQPIGAGGSGGSSSMAGVGQSSAKEIIKGIKAGYNPKVALVRYTNEEAEQVDEVTKKEAEETLGGPVKTKPKMPPGKQPEGYRYVRALARRAMKAGLKKEEVEQVDEVNRNKTKTDDYGGRYLDSINRDKEIKELERKISKMSPNDGGGRYLAGLKLDKMKAMKEEVEQMDEADYKKYLKASQEKRPLTMKSVDSALAADKAGDPNPLRKLQNTNAARKFAQKQLTKKFNASQPARPFPVYEPGRTYVGDSVEHDGPVIDEARRMSAAEKLGRAFDSEQQRSALSRQRGLDLLKQKNTEKMQNKPASGNMTKIKKEETEESTMKYIEEKLTAADPASKWISDFVKSDNPKFAGKSKKERIQQALGAYYAVKGKKNEEVVLEEPKDAADVGEYDYEGDMAKSQLRSIMANSKRMHDMLEDTTNLPEWVQSKITLAEDYVVTAANYMEGEMNEEVEQVDELRASTYASASNKRQAQAGTAAKVGANHASRVLQDKSDKLAYSAAMTGQREFLKTLSPATKRVMSKEEVEQVDELKKSTLASYIGKAAGRLSASSRLQRDFEKDGHTEIAGEFQRQARKKRSGIEKAANKLAKEEVEQIDEISPGLARKAAAASQVKAIEFSDYSGLSNLHNKEGKKEANRLNRKSDKAMDYIGKRQGQKGVDKVNRMVTRVVGEEVVTEAEGTVAVTPKEKSLAAHHGDKTKITFGDVLKARLKSAAAKKMGK
jgi:hypothetical protein